MLRGFRAEWVVGSVGVKMPVDRTRGGRVVRVIAGVFSLGLLAGCGVFYISPEVRADSSAQMAVEVVELTPLAAAAANGSQYSPKSLPAEFYALSGGGSGLRGAATLPDAPIPDAGPPPVLELRPPPAAEVQAYLIGVGDAVSITSNGGAPLQSDAPGANGSRQTYTVQDDGAISLASVGRIKIADMTLEQASNAVFAALNARQIDPAVSLDITSFNARKVSIGGAVARPGVLPVTLSPIYLDQALSDAGGIQVADSDFASIRIYRAGELYQIPVKQFYSDNSLKRVLLRDGDTVFVDTSFDLARAQAYFTQQIGLAQFRAQARSQALSDLQAEIALRSAALTEARSVFTERLTLDAIDRDYVYVTGEVKEQSRFALPFDGTATLADALYANQGVSTETANLSQLYLLRAQSGAAGVTAYHLDARNIVNLVLATQFELRPNDIIFVSEQPITKWNRALAQVIPALFSSALKN